MELKQQEMKVTARYASVQSGYWMSFAIIMSFASVFLLDRGFSNANIGLVQGIAGLLSIFLQPISGRAIDRSTRVPLRVFVAAGAGLLIGIAALLLPQRIQGWWSILFYGLMLAGIQTMSPLVSALGMVAINHGFKVNFGVARGIGSLSYALIAWLAGRLVREQGAGVLPWLLIILLGVLIVTSLAFNLRGTAGEAEAAAVEPLPAAADHYDRKRFVVLIIGLAMLLSSHTILNNFMFQIVSSHGGNSASLGTAISIGAILEIPPMFAYNYLSKRFSSANLIRVSAVGYVLKSLLAASAAGIGGIYLAQFMQLFSWGIYTPAAVYYVNRLLPASERVQGQALMNVAITTGGVVGAILGGWLIDSAGVRTLLLTGTGIAALGLLLAFPSVEQLPRET